MSSKGKVETGSNKVQGNKTSSSKFLLRSKFNYCFFLKKTKKNMKKNFTKLI